MKSHVPYDVVYCTSSDAAHPVTSLGQSTTGPFAGWQSAPGGKVPQTLVLRFAGNVELSQLRILSHESKIASRVEVRLFAIPGDVILNEPPSFSTARFAKLGTVEFSSNEHSNYRSKERKTVHVTAKAYFVKLLFGPPHHNAMNKEGQIGVYSIECTGRLVSPVDSHADVALHTSPIRSSGSVSPPDSQSRTPMRTERESPFKVEGRSVIRSTRSRNALRVSSPLPSPARDATCVPATVASGASGGLSVPAAAAAVGVGVGGEMSAFRSVRIMQFENFFIRRSEELLALKDQATSVDDFETAKKCRDRMNFMNRHSRRIYQLEQEKVQAIIEEDFDAAKEAKRVMDALIDRIYEDAQFPHPRPDFDPFDCIGDTSADMNEARGGSQQEPSGERLPEMPVKAKPILVKQKGSRSSSNERSCERDCSEATSNGYGHNQAKSDASVGDEDADEDVNNNSNSNTNNNDNGHDDANGEDIIDDGSIPLLSKCAQRVVDLVRDMGERIDGLDPPGLADPNDAIDSDIAIVDLSSLPAWESRVAGAIQSAGAGIDLTAPPAAIDLTRRGTREAMDLMASTGLYTTSCLFSRRVPLREAALTALTGHMNLFETTRPVQLEEAVLRFLDMNGWGLQDSVPSVVLAACGFVRMVLADTHACLSSLLAPVVNLLPRLLYCAADHQPRVREEAFATLTQYVRTPSITNATILTAVLAEPSDKERRRAPVPTPRAQLARLAVLDQLVTEARSGLRGAESNLWSKLLLPCVNHHSGEVRDAAVNVLNHLLYEKKFKLTARRRKEIDNAAIRELFAECTESPIGRGGKREKTPNGGRVKRNVKSKPVGA